MNLKLDPEKNYAIIGGAGAGKSTLAHLLTKENRAVTHLDDFFIKTSDFRKKLLEDKERVDWATYQDACNQMNWWNWDNVQKALTASMDKREKLLYEGAFLGPEFIWWNFDVVIYIQVPSEVRLERVIARDKRKRNGMELAKRFLITEYSEYIHYSKVLPYYHDIPGGLIVLDEDYERLPHYQLEEGDRFLPKKVVI